MCQKLKCGSVLGLGFGWSDDDDDDDDDDMCVNCRWGVWLWRPVLVGVWHGHGGAEHGAVQCGASLRRVLRDRVR